MLFSDYNVCALFIGLKYQQRIMTNTKIKLKDIKEPKNTKEKLQ